jgi:hypothetical protein
LLLPGRDEEGAKEREERLSFFVRQERERDAKENASPFAIARDEAPLVARGAVGARAPGASATWRAPQTLKKEEGGRERTTTSLFSLLPALSLQISCRPLLLFSGSRARGWGG